MQTASQIFTTHWCWKVRKDLKTNDETKTFQKVPRTSIRVLGPASGFPKSKRKKSTLGRKEEARDPGEETGLRPETLTESIFKDVDSHC